MKNTFRAIAAAVSVALASVAVAQTPVERHGQLRVQGTELVGEHGAPVQLRGVSMGWHNMWPRFYNGGTVERLTRDWGADIVRCSVGVAHLDSGFDCDSVAAYAVVDSIVGGAVRNGAYVLVDFHSHPNKLADARRFFTHVAGKYGHLPNMMYEIWNEPTEVPWSECKEYAEALVPVIRALDPDAVIVVPTPRWDQEVDKAAEDPVEGFGNLLYSLHYYAATHKQWLRDKAEYARAKGLPLIMRVDAPHRRRRARHQGVGRMDAVCRQPRHQLDSVEPQRQRRILLYVAPFGRLRRPRVARQRP